MASGTPRRRANAWAGVYCWLFEPDEDADGESAAR